MYITYVNQETSIREKWGEKRITSELEKVGHANSISKIPIQDNKKINIHSNTHNHISLNP